MQTSTLSDYIKTAVTSLPGVKNATLHQTPASWNVTGWLYNPPSMLFKGGLGAYMFSSESIEPDFYFISKPDVVKNSDGTDYQVSFLFGHLKEEMESSGMDLYLSIVLHFDADGNSKGTGHITAYESESGGPFSEFPLPRAVPFLPEGAGIGVDTALEVVAYAQELNAWLTENGYNDIYAGQMGTSGFGAIVLNRIVSAVRSAFLSVPQSAIPYEDDLAKPFLAAVRSWSLVDWKANDTYFEKSYGGQTVRCWWPTLVTQADTWTCVIKFDLVRSFGKDDHAIVALTGSLDRDVESYGHPVYFTASLGDVLAVSALTDYRNSGGGDLEVSTEQSESGAEPEDVLAAWLTSWTSSNETEPPDVVHFASGVNDLVNKFVAQLRTVASAPAPGIWSVAGGGTSPDATSFAVTAAAGVLTACCGKAYILDPLSHTGVKLASRTLPSAGANEVDLLCGGETGFAGCNGYVYALSLTNLADAFGGSSSSPTYNLSGTCGHGETRLYYAEGRLFAACNGYVFELDPTSATVRWSYDLTGLASSIGRNAVNLCFVDGLLYAASNGFVARLAVATTPGTACTGPSSSSTYYNLPHCGNHYSTLARSEAGDVYAACNGYAFKLDPASTATLWATQLSTIKSSIDSHTVYLCVVKDSTNGTAVLAGSNGYVVRLTAAGGLAVLDHYQSDHYSVNDGGQGAVHLFDDGQGGLAGCEGYVYRLNAGYYNVTGSPPTGSATLRFNLDLDDPVSVRLTFVGGIIYAGAAGAVYGLPYMPYGYS